MKALLVLDMQNCILNCKEFNDERKNIMELIKMFKRNQEIIIFARHVDECDLESPFYILSEKSKIPIEYERYADYTVKKKTPSMFAGTEVDKILKDNKIEHLVISGFNTEFCCMFTAIAAYDRGYRVTFVEDATGTVNDEDIYEMEGLDIKDFVGSVLDWSGAVEVLYLEEFKEIYSNL
ncbi:isochorismatase family cysteine hydrolase [Sporanaerobacter acetigenes]|uniref:isochorismatase family cysteine hydrolase n=1 Tax=Sporanaerobacter acetigenes TaxID=165813 RepID=UPI001050263A|nr:isochorismatase family cysteine hydrolase [Sporanaerobacter acetigenes]